MRTRKEIEDRIAEITTQVNEGRIELAKESTEVCAEHLFPDLVWIHELEVEMESLGWVLGSDD